MPHRQLIASEVRHRQPEAALSRAARQVRPARYERAAVFAGILSIPAGSRSPRARLGDCHIVGVRSRRAGGIVVLEHLSAQRLCAPGHEPGQRMSGWRRRLLGEQSGV